MLEYVSVLFISMKAHISFKDMIINWNELHENNKIIILFPTLNIQSSINIYSRILNTCIKATQIFSSTLCINWQCVSQMSHPVVSHTDSVDWFLTITMLLFSHTKITFTHQNHFYTSWSFSSITVDFVHLVLFLASQSLSSIQQVFRMISQSNVFIIFVVS